MSSAAIAGAPPTGPHPRWRGWLIGALVIVVFGAAANLLGWDIRGWFENLWDVMASISLGYLLAGDRG